MLELTGIWVEHMFMALGEERMKHKPRNVELPPADTAGHCVCSGHAWHKQVNTNESYKWTMKGGKGLKGLLTIKAEKHITVAESKVFKNPQMQHDLKTTEEPLQDKLWKKIDKTM